MPTCELLSVGTELLLGQILNTNAQFLSEELAALGISCYFQTTVGDNKQRIVACIRQALERSDIILLTGGLGPTADDLTTECVAEALGVDLIFDETVMKQLEEFFKTRGYKMPESNRKQAYRPRGADILPNPLGTAPGALWDVKADELSAAGFTLPSGSSRVIMTFPGVPGEMKKMWRDTSVPFLKKKFPDGAIYSCDLKHYGIGESALAEKYSHLLDLSNPTVAPYAGQGECKLRVTAHAATVEEAKLMAQPIIDEIESSSGDLLYGRNQDNLETVVGRMLMERKLTISVAESCTGGLVSKRLTDTAGSSAYIHLNVTTYADEAKHKVLGVSEETLKNHGAVSEECAREMCEGMKRFAGSDIAVAITGIAGPGGGSEEKPVGLVYIGIAYGGASHVRKIRFPSHITREEIRQRSASEALNMVRLFLLKDMQPAVS